MSNPIAHIVVGLPVEGPFDYIIPAPYVKSAQLGSRVLVSFAGRKRVGIIVGLATQSKIPKLKNILAVLDESPVFSPLFLLFAEAFALRFGCTQGEALELFLPSVLRSTRKTTGTHEADSLTRLKAAGRTAAEIGLVLDRGLSRRWEVLRPVVQSVLDAGRSIIFTAPDRNALQPVLGQLDSWGLKPVLLAGGTEKEDYEAWQKLNDGRARVGAGFISSVLAPVKRPGLIVIFDEESPSYKHDQSPFYHARDAAILRARVENCRVIFVSSAPSVELWSETEKGHVKLKVLDDALPAVKFLDLSNFKMKKDTFISWALRDQIEAACKAGKKVLLYIQASRGVAGVVAEARRMLPVLSVTGYDKESAKLLPADVTVSTQAIFRHRHTLRFDLAVVLDIDYEFHKADFRASQGGFALTQYLRQMTRDAVMLQTRQMSNELLHTFADKDILAFYRKEGGLRKEMGLPPYQFLVSLVVRSADPKLACDEAGRLYDSLASMKPENLEIHEPQQDRSAIVRGKFRWCVMVQGASIKPVMELVKGAIVKFRPKKDTVLTVNVNP